MSNILVLPTDTIDQFRQKTNQISDGLGDVSTLTTVATNAVDGINEVLNDVGDLNDLLLPGDNLVEAVNAAKYYALSISMTLG